jgi:transcription factor C subunit 6
MLDHFLPQESGTSEGPGYKDSTAPSKPSTQEDLKERFEKGQAEPSGLWHPSVAVTAVSWNNGCGPGRAHMLASCTASGLARIDVLEGRWMRGVVPYGSIEAIRRERTGSGDMASDSESE